MQNIEDQVDLLLTVVTAATWTEEEFRNMDKRNLRMFAAWNGEASKLPDAYKEQVAQKGFTVADKNVALKVYTTVALKTVSHLTPQTFMSTHGGQTKWFPTEVEYVALSGKSEKRSNSAIPARFGEADRYDNQQEVAVFCSQIVKNDQGVWKSNVNFDALNKTISSAELRVAGLASVSDGVCNLLSHDRVWKTMSVIQRNSVQGILLIAFVREMLSRLSPDTYDTLNTQIVCDAFNVFERRESKWAYVMIDNKKAVPETVYEARNAAPELKKRLHKYPDVFWYRGGHAPMTSFPQATGDLKSTQTCVQRMRDIVGSDTTPTVIMAGMKGYSGLSDDFGKKICWTLGAVLSVWSQNRQVDVQLETVGDIAMLTSSLNYWRKQIEANRYTDFCEVLETETGTRDSRPSCDFRFLLPKASDIDKIHVKLQELVVPQPREGTVIVAYKQGTIPTPGDKETKLDYDAQSLNIIPAIYRQNDVVLYTVIYGACPFSSDPAVKQYLTQIMAKLQMWPKRTYVHPWSNTCGFRGILTTLPSFGMAGYGYKMKDTHYDMSSETLFVMPLSVILKQEDWYKNVAKDARTQAFYWLYPISRYSPISNLPYLSKAGVTITLMSVVKEDGTLIGNVPRVANQGNTKITYYDSGESHRPDGKDFSHMKGVMTTASSSSVVNTTDPSDDGLSVPIVDPVDLGRVDTSDV